MKTFSEMNISAALHQRLTAAQFVTPTPVQTQAIPPALEGKDIVATAQTGTGKTLAFLIPAIEMLEKTDSRNINVLVLVPTRELAMQVHEQFEALRQKKMPPAALVIGGVSEKQQIRALRSNARLVVATPGRLEDYLRRRLVDLRHVQMLVLDEADRMLDMGFLPAIRRILAVLPQKRQTVCFSATLEQSVAGLVAQCVKNPVRVALGNILKPAASVELQAIETTAMQKSNVLRDLLYNEKGKTLVFARTKRGTERLAKELMRDGFSAAMIHGDRSQSQRNAALSGFEEGRFKVLVATDVAARGIHVDDVAHVVNFDLPSIAEDFIHRVGRTGRAGATGKASTLVSGAEIGELRRFERTLKLQIKRTSPPASAGVTQARSSRSPRNLMALPGEVFV